jgi:hypothetical protein
VLERFSDANLHSETVRLTIAASIIKEMKNNTGWFLDLSKKISYKKSTYRPYSKEVTDA